jgi:hypothetical protein
MDELTTEQKSLLAHNLLDRIVYNEAMSRFELTGPITNMEVQVLREIVLDYHRRNA